MPCKRVSSSPRSIKRVLSSLIGASCISLSQTLLLAGLAGLAFFGSGWEGLFRFGGVASELRTGFEASLSSGLGAGLTEAFLRETSLLKRCFNFYPLMNEQINCV